MRMKTYSEMLKHHTLASRFRYLALRGQVGVDTFGFDRYLGQRFYTSREWRSIRTEVIIRDQGCDLGVPGFDVHDRVLIHHMNPIKPEDLKDFNEDILNPEYLVLVSHNTHNAIHYGDEGLLPRPFIERRPGDTKLW